jgi:hypothetical protein
MISLSRDGAGAEPVILMVRSIIRIAAWIFVIAGAAAGSLDVRAQNPFPDPIQKGNIRALIQDFAVVPDSGTSSSAPARINLMTADPDGRLFANDQRGKLFHISDDGSTVTEYLDIDDFSGVDLRTASGEQGFQSFAFHPDFHVTGADGHGKIYTIHSSSNNSPIPDFNPGGSNDFHSVLMEWTVSNSASNTYAAGGGSAPREVMRLQQPFSNHNAGQLAFNPTAGTGPDRGNLYIGIGDGGSGGDLQENGQDTGNPYGAVLRIDPLGDTSSNRPYGIVADNFFAADGDAGTIGEIYAYGLRNPQRFSWDDLTGEMYIADIGQNAVEEINRGVNGGNFGWDQREGSFKFEGPKETDMLDPIAEYDHTDAIINPSTAGRAVTIGDVTRELPGADLNGLLLFGDFPTGAIFYTDVDSDPLDGGQDGVFELELVDSSGASLRLIDLINETRLERELNAGIRADLRFSFAVDGQTFVTNKHDGTIRRITVVPEPNTSLLLASGLVAIARRRRRAGSK